MHGQLTFADAVNWDDPLTRGLVSWWMCLPEQQRGVYWRDLCGRSVGTLTNMDPPTDWQGPQGRPGGFGCLDFSSDSDAYVIPSGFRFFDVADATISFWCKAPLGSSTTRGFVIDRVSNVDNPFFKICASTTLSGTDRPFLRVSVRDATVLSTSTYKVLDGQWHYIVWSDNNGSWFLNVDGKLDSSGSYTKATFNSNAFEIGNDGRTLAKVMSSCDGQIDGLQVWKNRYLNQGEALSLYHDSLLGYHRMLNWRRRRIFAVDAGGGGGGANTGSATLDLEADFAAGGYIAAEAAATLDLEADFVAVGYAVAAGGADLGLTLDFTSVGYIAASGFAGPNLETDFTSVGYVATYSFANLDLEADFAAEGYVAASGAIALDLEADFAAVGLAPSVTPGLAAGYAVLDTELDFDAVAYMQPSGAADLDVELDFVVIAYVATSAAADLGLELDFDAFGTNTLVQGYIRTWTELSSSIDVDVAPSPSFDVEQELLEALDVSLSLDPLR